MIQINGNEAMQADGMSIADYLLSEGYVLSHIAVERNEVIVSKKDYAFVAQYLMENYYDRLYRHSEKKYTYEFSVCSDKMEETIKTIINWHKKKLMSKEIGDQL